MCTKVVSFFIFFQEFSNKKKIKAHIPQIVSSQALPTLKVAIDNECLGKGLAFTKNI